LEVWRTAPKGVDINCDVAVLGGGLSGVAAAVAASRRGSHVVLIEELHMLGGQATTSGVSAMDVTFFYDRALNAHGIWGEFYQRVLSLYRDELRRPVNVCRYRDDSFGPNAVVVEHVLAEMLREAGVTVLRNTRLEFAIRSDGLTRLVFDGCRVRAKVAIDATEDGQLIAALGVPHRLGVAKWTQNAYSRSDLERVAVQDITRTALVRRYPDGQIPADLLVAEPPPGYAQMRPFIVRSYPRGPVTNREGDNGFAGYRAVPDLASDERYLGSEWQKITRTSLNYHNDQKIFADYFTSESARRAYIVSATALTLGIIYYLQAELHLPWSVATDEGYADGPNRPDPIQGLEDFASVTCHMPPRPYVREARRLVGVETLTGKDIFRLRNHGEARWNVDSVAVGTYPPDLHGGRAADDLEADIGEVLADKPGSWREGPFGIPLGTLVPVKADGLVAAEKNISTSRIANGAARVHPTVMSVGEAAGVLAALAAKTGRSVRDVPVEAVQVSLACGGALLAPLAVRDVTPADADFGHIVMALARKLVPHAIDRSSGEPELVVDRVTARQRGQYFSNEISKSFGSELDIKGINAYHR